MDKSTRTAHILEKTVEDLENDTSDKKGSRAADKQRAAVLLGKDRIVKDK